LVTDGHFETAGDVLSFNCSKKGSDLVRESCTTRWMYLLIRFINSCE